MNPIRVLIDLAADTKATRRNTEAILRQGAAILSRLDNIMSAQDDMTAAIGDLKTAVTSENTKINDLVTQLASAATNAGVPAAGVEGYVTQIKAITDGVNSTMSQFAPPAPPAAS